MVQRLTYRRHNRYNTRSNKTRVVRLPGGRNILQNTQKTTNIPKCGDCKKPLQGVPAIRPVKLARIARHKRRVSRVYGGSRCHKCVRARIVRAFLLEEQKCVKAVLLEKERQKAEAYKKTKSKKTSKTKKP